MSTSTTTTFKVPQGMSPVNAFHALWKNSRVAAFYQMYPDSPLPGTSLQDVEARVDTAGKVAALFREYLSFDYEGGRRIKIDFSSFPCIDPTDYDQQDGIGSAQAAIEAYAQVPSKDRFDRNDFHQFEKLTDLGS